MGKLKTSSRYNIFLGLKRGEVALEGVLHLGGILYTVPACETDWTETDSPFPGVG